MKKLITGLAAGAVALISFAGTANAAPWQQPINQREARLEMQIRHGVRSGALTRVEAARLSDRLHGVEQLEQNFRRGGLTFAERRMLDQRLDALERSIHMQMADGQLGYGRHFHRG
jgi:hypothetical protein